MLNNSIKISFNIQTEWHIASGEEGGAYADSLMLKDANNLPFIPGRSVRGLLREACQIAIDNQWEDNDFFSLLFGYSDEHRSSQGVLRVSNATLSKQERSFFTNHGNEVHQHLYRVHYSTAIDKKTGVADNGSLRGIEVAAPMTLTSSLTLDTNHPNIESIDNDRLHALLVHATPLITNIGAKRHRGYGQIEVTVTKVQGESQ